MGKLLDPTRSFGENRGGKHFYTQDNLPFDHKGRECDLRTGVALDPNDEGLSDAVIFDRPPPAVASSEVDQLKAQVASMQRALSEQANKISALSTAPEVRSVQPLADFVTTQSPAIRVPEQEVVDFKDYTKAELVELCDQSGISYHPSAKKADLIRALEAG